MKSTFSYVATAVIAMASGFVAGVLLAPRSGEDTRQRIASQAKEQLKAAESQLEAVEGRLAELNGQLQETRKEVSGKIKKAAHDAVEQHLPEIAEEFKEWSEGGEDEVVRDLRNMTRR